MNTDNMKIREIKSPDIDPCANLFVTIFSNPPWNETWSFEGAKPRLSDCFHSANFFGLLMEDADGLHGFAFGNIQYFLPCGCFAVLLVVFGEGKPANGYAVPRIICSFL